MTSESRSDRFIMYFLYCLSACKINSNCEIISKESIIRHLAFSSINVYGFCGTPCLRVESPGFPKGVLRPVGVMRPDGVALPLGVTRLGVAVPSPTGLKLVTNTTGGDRVGAVVFGAAGVTSAAVVAGTYMGTDEMGLPMAGGGDTSGGGDTGGVRAGGGTTLTGLRGLGRTTGGEGLAGGV